MELVFTYRGTPSTTRATTRERRVLAAVAACGGEVFASGYCIDSNERKVFAEVPARRESALRRRLGNARIAIEKRTKNADL